MKPDPAMVRLPECRGVCRLRGYFPSRRLPLAHTTAQVSRYRNAAGVDWAQSIQSDPLRHKVWLQLHLAPLRYKALSTQEILEVWPILHMRFSWRNSPCFTVLVQNTTQCGHAKHLHETGQTVCHVLGCGDCHARADSALWSRLRLTVNYAVDGRHDVCEPAAASKRLRMLRRPAIRTRSRRSLKSVDCDFRESAPSEPSE